MNANSAPPGFQWPLLLLLPTLLCPQAGRGQNSVFDKAAGARFPDDGCRDRTVTFMNPARLPADLNQPEATLMLFAGEPLCVQLTKYLPLKAGTPSKRPQEKMWSAGALGLVDPACPFTFMGAEGFYLLRFYTPLRSGGPLNAFICGEGRDENAESALLMALPGETTVVTYRTEQATSQTYWKHSSELRAMLSGIADPPRPIRVPGGEFFMGCDTNARNCPPDSAPGHQVKLDHEFTLVDAEVSLGEYLSKQLSNSSALPVVRPLRVRDPRLKEGLPLWLPLSYPATMMSWDEASQYCLRAGGRLPTEAEWERAAGLNQTADHGGLPPVRTDREQLVRKMAEQRRLRPPGRPDAPDSHGLLPVRSQLPGLRGLYDMTGNVSQWVEDWFDPKYYSERRHDNPEGAYLGKQRLVRGSGAGEIAGFELQESARFLARTDETVWTRFTRDGKPAPDIGFRCAFDWTVGD